MTKVVDEELINVARELIAARFKEGSHHIAAALHTTSGRIYKGVHLEAYVGRIAVCAEAIAIGAAATAGDTSIETIVAVNGLGRLSHPVGCAGSLSQITLLKHA